MTYHHTVYELNGYKATIGIRKDSNKDIAYEQITYKKFQFEKTYQPQEYYKLRDEYDTKYKTLYNLEEKLKRDIKGFKNYE